MMKYVDFVAVVMHPYDQIVILRPEGAAVHRGAVSKRNVLVQPQRCVRMVEMQGAEAEGEGSVLAYTTESECR